jgi:hypothetical protein
MNKHALEKNNRIKKLTLLDVLKRTQEPNVRAPKPDNYSKKE